MAWMEQEPWVLKRNEADDEKITQWYGEGVNKYKTPSDGKRGIKPYLEYFKSMGGRN